MTERFSPFLEMVTLLGGGELTAETVSDLLTVAPNLVVCDGAAARAFELGFEPGWVVGDMDSLDPATRARLAPETLLEITEQETTDFDKALRAIDAPLILGAGFRGGRLDHELACYASLVRHAATRCILVGADDICFHAPDAITLDLDPGTRVSLFPMAEVRVSATGLAWPLDRLTLAPWGRVGTSNRATAARITITPEGPGLLVIVPRRALGAAIAAHS